MIKECNFMLKIQEQLPEMPKSTSWNVINASFIIKNMVQRINCQFKTDNIKSLLPEADNTTQYFEKSQKKHFWHERMKNDIFV